MRGLRIYQYWGLEYRRKGELVLSGGDENRIAPRSSRRREHLYKEPIPQCPPDSWAGSDKFNSRLTGRISPGYSSSRFYSHPWRQQIKTQTDFLFRPQSRNRVNGNAGVRKVADDSAIALIQIDGGQGSYGLARPPASPGTDLGLGFGGL